MRVYLVCMYYPDDDSQQMNSLLVQDEQSVSGMNCGGFERYIPYKEAVHF